MTGLCADRRMVSTKEHEENINKAISQGFPTEFTKTPLVGAEKDGVVAQGSEGKRT